MLWVFPIRTEHVAPVAKARKLAVRAAIQPAEVATYIKLGRQRVLNTKHDPYSRYKNPTGQMMRDAMIIAQWFNANRVRWNVARYLEARKEITDIQKGPSYYWRQLLSAHLTPVHLKVAESWAERHKAGQYVDVRLSPEVRDNVFAVLDRKLRLRNEKEPYQAMLEVLRFAFHGLPAAGMDNELEL